MRSSILESIVSFWKGSINLGWWAARRSLNLTHLWWRYYRSTNVLICCHLLVLDNLVIHVFYDFGSGFDWVQFELYPLILELDVALFNLVRRHNLIYWVDELAHEIPIHIGRADNHCTALTLGSPRVHSLSDKMLLAIILDDRTSKLRIL